MLASPTACRVGILVLAAMPTAAHAQITLLSRDSTVSALGGLGGGTIADTSFLPFRESLTTRFPPSLPIATATQDSSIAFSTISLEHSVTAIGGGNDVQGFYEGIAISTFDATFTIASPSPFTLTGNFFSDVIGGSSFYNYSCLFTRVDQPATLFNLTTQPFYNPGPQGFILSNTPFNVSGNLSPGTYRFRSGILTSGNSIGGPANSGGLSVVLTIPIPSPAASLPLGFGLLALAFRRKR